MKTVIDVHGSTWLWLEFNYTRDGTAWVCEKKMSPSQTVADDDLRLWTVSHLQTKLSVCGVQRGEKDEFN